MQVIDTEPFLEERHAQLLADAELLADWSEMLFGDLPNAVLVNLRGRVVYANPPAGQLLCLDPRELLGRPSFDHFDAGDRAGALAQLAASSSPHCAGPVTRRQLRRGDGRSVAVELALIVLPVLDGGESLVVEVLREPEPGRGGTSKARSTRARAHEPATCRL